MKSRSAKATGRPGRGSEAFGDALGAANVHRPNRGTEMAAGFVFHGHSAFAVDPRLAAPEHESHP